MTKSAKTKKTKPDPIHGLKIKVGKQARTIEELLQRTGHLCSRVEQHRKALLAVYDEIAALKARKPAARKRAGRPIPVD